MKKNNKGFTLAEMLIVVAIIGILIAITVNVFANAREKAREAVDMSNIRSAMSELQQAALLEDTSIAKSITYNKNGYYQKIVYCTQEKTKWQCKNNASKINIGGTEVTVSSYSKVPEFWYVRYYVKGENTGTFKVNVKSNKPS